MNILILALSLLVQQQDSAAFVKRFVAAVNTHAVAQRLALQDPRDAACHATSFIDLIVSRQAHYEIGGNYRWNIKPITAPLPFDDMVTYAVKPTHILQLDFKEGPYSFNSVIVRLRHDATGWHEIFGCPTQEALARISTAMQQMKVRGLEVSKRLAEMPKPIRDSINTLLDQGQQVSAIFYYAKAARSDTTTANEVVDSLISLRKHPR